MMPASSPDVSLVVVAYEMERELPRTIRSLSPDYQNDISADQYELILVDNGSTKPIPIDDLARWGARIRQVEPPRPSPSPAGAANAGITAAAAPLIGVMIDGARIATPGLITMARAAGRLHPRPLIGTVGFHLGPAAQMKTVAAGYDEATEDRLLDDIGWPAEGYRLFEIAALAGSSRAGWFAPIAESNAMFMPRACWEQMGGFDDRFASPGGGLVNLDTWKRACEELDTQPIVLLGEATFHQVHGGVATNAKESPWTSFHDEYMRLRRAAFEPPAIDPVFVGRLPRTVLPWVQISARDALTE